MGLGTFETPSNKRKIAAIHRGKGINRNLTAAKVQKEDAIPIVEPVVSILDRDHANVDDHQVIDPFLLQRIGRFKIFSDGVTESDVIELRGNDGPVFLRPDTVTQRQRRCVHIVTIWNWDNEHRHGGHGQSPVRKKTMARARLAR